MRKSTYLCGDLVPLYIHQSEGGGAMHQFCLQQSGVHQTGIDILHHQDHFCRLLVTAVLDMGAEGSNLGLTHSNTAE